MICDTLPFQKERPEPGAPVRRSAFGHGFERPAVGKGMGNGAVARHAACQSRSVLPGKGLKPFFYALVHVSQPLLEIDDIFTDRLETKMTRLDDPRVHGGDGHFLAP